MIRRTSLKRSDGGGGVKCSLGLCWLSGYFIQSNARVGCKGVTLRWSMATPRSSPGLRNGEGHRRRAIKKPLRSGLLADWAVRGRLDTRRVLRAARHADRPAEFGSRDHVGTPAFLPNRTPVPRRGVPPVACHPPSARGRLLPAHGNGQLARRPERRRIRPGDQSRRTGAAQINRGAGLAALRWHRHD